MKRSQFIWVILSVFVIAPGALAESPDVKGWREAKWGMTEAEVLKAFKGEVARRPEPKESRGSLSPVHIPDYEIESERFEADFWFKQNSLTSVAIHKNLSGSGVPLFGLLERMLSAKYGPPSSERRKDMPLGGAFWELVWSFKSTRISLLLTGIPQAGQLVQVQYLMTPEDINKL